MTESNQHGARVVVAGLGSEHRRDDGSGPIVATRAVEATGTATDVGPLSDPLDLLGRWDGADLAIVVDAVRSGAEPGTVHVVDLDARGAPTGPGTPRSGDPDAGDAVALTSTHGIGLAGALRLARITGHAPRRVVVVGIEGEDFGMGCGLSQAVEAAVPRAVRRVTALIEEGATCA